MERFLQALASVIAATQRQILLALVRQLVLITATGIGLWKLSGTWWCLCLAAFVACLLWAVFLAFALKWQSEILLEPPWRAIGMEPNGELEHRLELHLMNGSVQVLRVRPKLVAEVKNAAKEAGLEIVTEPVALRAVHATSIRLGRIRDIEVLVPHVPDAALRAELTSTLTRLRATAPPGCDDLLFALRRLLEAEQKAQKKTQGSTTVYEQELKEKLAAFAKLLA